VLIGGFTTNFLWCVVLNVRNRSGHEYLGLRPSAAVQAAEHGRPQSLGAAAAGIPLVRNYLLSAAAGITWYFQFFFYSMGQTRMGPYEFSSWTLHMASIIIFSTLWGVALREWRGTSSRTHLLIGAGLAVLIGSTVVVGYGNFLKSAQ
jgi:L-rhamnose-H+ transport protein